MLNTICLSLKNKMCSPLVSILIPCYNAEKWLAETLESALSQTWKNIEIILVDDGSTDNSLAIARNYESKNVKVIAQENRGASSTRNNALKQAQGDFIQYLDADDLIALDKIERQLVCLGFDRESKYIASGEWSRFFKHSDEARFVPQEIWVDLYPVDWLASAWKDNLMMHPAAWLLPRKVSNLAGYWNENISLNDDGEYFSRSILASDQVKFCMGARSYYRSGISGSLSGLKSRKACESAFLAAQLCTKRLLDVENSDLTRYAASCYWQHFIFLSYLQVPDLIRYAESQIYSLGGCDLKPDGGIGFKIVRDIFGWKLAMHLQRFYYRYRYSV